MLKIEQQAELITKKESLKKLSLFVLRFLVWRMSILYLYIEKGRLSVKNVLIIGWGMVCVGYAALLFLL